MTQEIDTLWALHGLDEEIARIEAALARFPEERSALAKRLADERARLERVKSQLAELQKRRRDLEREAQALGETEKRFQTQLLSVKKNEEYQALLHEIEATRGKRSDLETEILLALESEDESQRERPVLEQALQALEREAAARVAALDAEEAAERARIAALDAERQGHVAALPDTTRTRYERVRGSRNGRAVVPILKGACGGCFRAQPPQVLQEARHRDKLISCQGCGRLLVWPPEGVAAT